MKALAFAALLALLLVPASALAWLDGPGSSRSISSISKTGEVAYHETSGTTDSTALRTNCRDVDVYFDPDTTGTAVGAEVQVYKCQVGGTASTATCVRVCATRAAGFSCDTLNGDETAERAGFQNLQADFVWADVTANAGADAIRVSVTCH